MKRAVYASDVDAELSFARKAAKHFAEHPEHNTYAEDEIQQGCFLAIRWGLMDDCVVVVKLDESHVPTNYMELVRSEGVAA